MNPAVYLFGIVTIGYFVIALATTWHQTFGPMFESLARNIESFTIPVPIPRVPDIHFGFLANAVRYVSRTTQIALSDLASSVAAPLVSLYHALANLINSTTSELGSLSQDVAHTLGQYRRVIIPAMIAAKVAWIPRHIAALEAKVQALLTRTPVHITKDVTNYAKGAFLTIVHKAVAVPIPRIGRLEREAGALGKRIDRIARRIAPAALAAATVAALGRLGAGWLRCSRVKSAGKAVCGMDQNLLDSLLADAVLVVGTVSLVDFAKGMQDGTSEIAGAVRAFWRA